MRYATLLLLLTFTTSQAQVLVDSIPYPGVNQSFSGIHVTPDTIFLGADGPGNVVFSDHDGMLQGFQSTGFTFNHGLIHTGSSYLIAQDYTANGAHLYEVGLDGTLLNTWTFPDVIGGHSSGIGDLCADGDAIWYTMYYPDFDAYPYAYAYKWVPGDAAPIDTVPLQGEQPYGIALRGDTLYYVTDNLNGDLERIYAYDLVNEATIGSVPLPDSDNDQSPRGMFYDGNFLYLVANRTGASASSYQTIFIYAFDPANAIWESGEDEQLTAFPNPAMDRTTIWLPNGVHELGITDTAGRLVHSMRARGGRNVELDTQKWAPGSYQVRTTDDKGVVRSARLIIAR
ncbi:MAG TPA: T9SS type A sorting domain-containing protein [Flavobacteriales bacterium]|nr:T9SS type A sorting domain-containing protein [Flavobacteriales bacterium]